MEVSQDNNQDNLSLKQNQQKVKQNHHDIEIKCKTQSDRLLKNYKTQELPILIEMNVKNNEQILQRNNIDFIFLIDISGSMQGENIKLVKKSILFLIRQMSQNDRLCLITFNKFVKKIIDLTPITQQNLCKIEQIIQEIKTGGSTNIKGAIEEGINVIINRQETQNIPSLILLTDGMDTCGNSRLKILKMMNQREQQLQQQQQHEIDLNCFGFGEAHDDKLLMLISSEFKGRFYYIQNSKFIDECLIDCFSDLMSIIYKQANLSIFCSKNCKIMRDIGNDLTIDKQNQQFASIKLKNIVSGTKKQFMLIVQLNPNKKEEQKEEEKEVRLLMLVLKFYKDDKEYQITKQFNLELAEKLHQIGINKDVYQEFIKIKSIDKVEQYSQYLQDGNQNEAKQLKNDYIKELKNDKIINSKTIEQIEAIFDKQNFQNITMNNAYIYSLKRQQYMPGFRNYQQQNQNSQQMTKRLHNFI